MTMLRRLPLVATLAAVIAVVWSSAPAYAAALGPATPVVAVSKKPIAVVGALIIVIIGVGVAVWYTRRNRQ